MVTPMIDGIGYLYRQILAIILYGCHCNKRHSNAINVAPQSCCDTYSAEMKKDYGMYLPGLNTYTTM